MTLEKVYDELISMIEDLRSGQRLVDSAIADLQKETQGAQRSTGNPIEINAAPVNAKALIVTLTPNQTGSGDPSPTNVRPITGYTECEVETADSATDPTITNTATIQFGQTVYGGKVNVTDGGTDDDRGYVDLGTEATFEYNSTLAAQNIFPFTVSGRNYNTGANAPICDSLKVTKKPSWTLDEYEIVYIDSHEKMRIRFPNCTTVSDIKTATAGMHLCYEKATPDTIQTPPTDFKLLEGTNNISVDGNAVIDITYQPNNVLGQILAESEAYADSVVTITPALESGTKLADYTISGTAGIIYGPGETQVTRKTTTKKSTKEE